MKFSSAVSGEIRGKKNSANGTITWHLTRAFERGARRLHWVITGLKRAICEVFQEMEDSTYLSSAAGRIHSSEYIAGPLDYLDL